jgi:putative membrane protein
MYPYLKALHIIFVVTWFAGMFYMPRLFIYSTESQDRDAAARQVLQEQFRVMMRRLWYGITWPSALITLAMGIMVMLRGGWWTAMMAGSAAWLVVKLVFVLLLYLYHFTLHHMFRKISTGQYAWSSQQLRIWNEVATVFLFAIVFLATVKQRISFLWGLAGLVLLVVLLVVAIRMYRRGGRH